MLETLMKLREEKRFEEARDLMERTLEREPDNAVYQYQMAWCYDNLGLEKEAVPHYELAIQIGLPAKELEGAYLGLGSTYRVLGRHDEAADTLKEAMFVFPKSETFKVFYSMVLYNFGQYQQAMEVLLHALVHTTNDESILTYKKAILFYSDKLDQVW
ncbi:tetratricopeptide repeat protein [Jeotgalibacillus terrae]|uniref:Tetratricopeptide repeat protein n=1 Tax=Jeotgalibacillus terrae TaxID=587735 RepID=A0ABW5ZHC7_9BACL|nr:tetratricopeptide repeat protein [Jeotgalibacillus terrae]MBM7578789.1 tetratricopeptide (TPR) repeat protein [Jeotgalibacillus terrae]